MQQQLQAKQLNDRRVELEEQVRSLETRRAEMRKLHASAMANASSLHDGNHEKETVEGARSSIDTEGLSSSESQIAPATIGTEHMVGTSGTPDMLVGRALETAAATRDYYARTLHQQEDDLRARQQAFTLSLAERRHQARDQGYSGEFGAHTYRDSQLQSFKVARSILLELIGTVLTQIHDDNYLGASENQLRAEYDNWQRSHRALERRLQLEVRALFAPKGDTDMQA